jgi:hypothetical protein
MNDEEAVLEERYRIQAEADRARAVLAGRIMSRQKRRAFEKRIDALMLKWNLKLTAERAAAPAAGHDQ